MNVSNLRWNNLNIALANYVMKPLKSTYLYLSLLVIDLYQTHWNEIPESVTISIVSVASVSLDLRQAITY